ncbi:portal protein [Enterobacter roggenkampii]|uniref:portal protein n=1 Tax=Enterobacter roggenkampii TaxID=1812935 RepID=UPI002431F577|nr:portal protein [Enterobacter roggenkampii]WFX59760.1 portal protein [Enterobacter roggenkampii]
MASRKKQPKPRKGLGRNGAAAAYSSLMSDRDMYIQRALDCARVTVPSWFPDDCDNSSTYYKSPYQSMGAMCVNSLTAKLSNALFPMTQPFFKLSLNEFVLKQVESDKSQMALVEQGLSMCERIITQYMADNSYRVTLTEAMRQLVISGNALLYITPPEDSVTYNPCKLYKIHNYVVQRDGYGNILQIVTKEKIACAALPDDLKENLNGMDAYDDTTEIDVYTHIYLDDKTGEYLSYEEIDGNEIAGTASSYPIHALPWIPIRMNRLDGESYGRSYTEEYLGDLRSLENLNKSILDITMISSKVVGIVNPTGITKPGRLVNAKSGDFVPGNPNDIQYLQVNKSADYTLIQNLISQIEQRLAQAFLLNSAVQRNGDRVTAEEIRYVAQQLESVMTGVYSVLNQEMQLPIVRVLMNQLQATSKIPDLPKEALTPNISAGLEALGRGQDLDKLNQFVQAMGAVAGLAQDQDVNMGTLKLRICNALGIDTDGLLLTEEEKQQMQMQQMAQMGMQNAASTAGAGMGALATQNPEALSQTMQNMGVEPRQAGK